MSETNEQLLERIAADPRMSGVGELIVPIYKTDVGRLLALARKGLETERLRDLLERARYQLPGGLLGDEPNTLIDEIESALAPKEPPHA